MSDAAGPGAVEAALAAKAPEGLGLGRYEVHLAEGRVELRVRKDPFRVATVIHGLGAAVALLAPLAAIGAEHRDTGFLVALGAGFGAFLAVLAGSLEAQKRSAYFEGAFVLPRRVLTIDRTPGDYRQGDRDVMVRVDDGPPRAPTRVAFSGTAITVTAGSIPVTTVFFHAGLVFPDRYVRVDTFKGDPGPALRTARALARVLGLPAPDVDPVVEPALEHAGMFTQVILMLADIGSYPALAYLLCQSTGATAGRLAVAGLLWLPVHVALQRLALRAMRASLLGIALQVYGVAPGLD